QGLVEAAEQRRAFSQHGLPAGRGRQVPRAALGARLRAGQDGTVSEAAASARLARAPPGGGGARAPESKRRPALDVGERPLARARGPPGGAGVTARLGSPVAHRWRSGVPASPAAPLRPGGPARAPAGPRPGAQAAWAAAAAVTIGAGEQDRTPAAPGTRAPPG